ncbi:MAG: response regulator [Pseudomonadota bacterium]
MKKKKYTVLAIDDTAENLGLLESLLENQNYQVLVATNGERGFDIVKKQRPDIILLDVMMPGWDGFETARRIKSIPELSHIPILFLSALDDPANKVKGFNAGGVDYVAKPFQQIELLARIKTHLELGKLRNSLSKQVEQKTLELTRFYEDSLQLLSMVSEFRDYETSLHNKRLGEYAKRIAGHLNLSDEIVDLIILAAPLHDVGKIGIPDSILHKQGPLEPGQWDIMKNHPNIGQRILSSIKNNSILSMASEIASGHHEAYDGSGYPNALKGIEIPLSARITSICDVYDALRSQRPYKKSFSHQESFDIITKGDRRTKPEHFDPQVLAVFIKHHQEFDKIFEEMREAEES